MKNAILSTLRVIDINRNDREARSIFENPNFFKDYQGANYVETKMKWFRQNLAGQNMDFIPTGIADLDANYFYVP